MIKNKLNWESNADCSKGITLIALVVTIVILLILAGVTITFVLGEDGIINMAKKAADETKNAAENEQKSFNELMGELENIIDGSNSNNEKTDWKKIKSELESTPDKYKHSEQSADNLDRAVGTDGKPVNLDLWKYYITNDGQGVSLGKVMGSTRWQGYKGQIIDGKIEGTMPQYIYIKSSEKVLPVTGLFCTFYNYTHDSYTEYGDTTRVYDDLTTAPELPSTVVDMEATFSYCKKLTAIPKLPENLKTLCSADGSTGNGPFEGCIGITSAPEIPSSVMNMDYAFSYCTNLSGIVKINSKNVSSANGAFDETVNQLTIQVPADSTTYTTMSSAYKNVSNIIIEQF